MTTHIRKASDLELVARRAHRTIELLETRGEQAWKLTLEWSSPLRGASGDEPVSGGGIASSPTESAALADDDDLIKMHSRYRAALALAVTAFDELEQIITTATASGAKAQKHRRRADDKALWCTSCERAGGHEPRRGARWCRWCEDTVRALANEWTWESNTAPPLKLVELHLQGRRITVDKLVDVMRSAGAKRRPPTPEQEVVTGE